MNKERTPSALPPARPWKANRDAVNRLLRAFGYPGVALEEPRPNEGFRMRGENKGARIDPMGEDDDAD